MAEFDVQKQFHLRAAKTIATIIGGWDDGTDVRAGFLQRAAFSPRNWQDADFRQASTHHTLESSVHRKRDLARFQRELLPFQIPLIKPDVRLSRVRLLDKGHSALAHDEAKLQKDVLQLCSRAKGRVDDR
jgi:hypothetical protein